MDWRTKPRNVVAVSDILILINIYFFGFYFITLRMYYLMRPLKLIISFKVYGLFLYINFSLFPSHEGNLAK